MVGSELIYGKIASSAMIRQNTASFIEYSVSIFRIRISKPLTVNINYCILCCKKVLDKKE